MELITKYFYIPCLKQRRIFLNHCQNMGGKATICDWAGNIKVISNENTMPFIQKAYKIITG